MLFLVIFGEYLAGHEKIAKSLEAEVYFSHPYASREGGTNENANGLASTSIKTGSLMM
ncbi:MAG: hypothetical protein J7K88_10050 [Candidatus Fermentibacteraceae bacterium]|nr:hypothetical protein [Candidatus Fermentibacteraceae bacterium]